MTSSASGHHIGGPTKHDILEAEVPNEILEQFRILEKALKDNDKLAQEFEMNTSVEEMERLDANVAQLVRVLAENRSELRRERMKNHVLSERVARDVQMSERVQRRKEMLQKNPQYGRTHAIEYMHAVADEHERTLLEHETTMARVEQMLRSLMDEQQESNQITERDLAEHIQRFDEIFVAVSEQVCHLSEDVERLKENFLERQKKIYGRYAHIKNPFEKRKERQKMNDAFANLKGFDAFPSQHAVLSMCEFLPRQASGAPIAAGGTGTGFGSVASSGLFAGAKPAAAAGTSSGFLFGGGQSATATKPFSLGGAGTGDATSIFGSATAPAAKIPASSAAGVKPNLFGTTPLSVNTSAAAPTASSAPAAFSGFGATGAAVPASSAASTSLFGATVSSTSAAPAFGSTLNSAASGTLFGGSASTSGAPPTKSLFGAK